MLPIRRLVPTLLAIVALAATARRHGRASRSVASVRRFPISPRSPNAWAEARRGVLDDRRAEDAHFAEPRPSFVKRLADADVYIEIGLELEAAYAPVLLQNARNPAVVVSAPGHITAADAVPELIGPSGPITRARGDARRRGSALPRRSAAAAGGRRADSRSIHGDRPAHAADFAREYEAFRQDVLTRLDGWLARMAPHPGAKVVDDHAMWRLRAASPRDRRPPRAVPAHTADHQAPGRSRRANACRPCRRHIASPYYDVRHAEKVAGATGAVIARDSPTRPAACTGTEDYVAMVITTWTIAERSSGRAGARERSRCS
jgi:hypothetical protein